MSDDPIPDAGSRKRKRPPSDTGSSESRIHSAEVNLEKLVKKLTGKRDDRASKSFKSNNSSSDSKFNSRQKKKQSQPAADVDKKKNISLPMPLMTTTERAAKKAKRSHEIRSQASKDSLPNHSDQANEDSAESSSGLTSMQKNMKQKLDGARFR